MPKKSLPKTGDVIPANKFHMSKCNVRYGQPFGKDEDDEKLIHQVHTTKKLVEVFKARPEEGGFGVYAGGRRFQAAIEAGFTAFTVGKDVLTFDLSDEEAMDESLIENLDFLRKHMDPMMRARRINERISSSPGGLRAYAGRIGVPPSTLSEWLKVLDLGEKMQEAVSKGLLGFSDGVKVARMELGETAEEELATTLETEGVEAFQKELERHAGRRLKRGIPKGKYEILRITFDRVYAPDLELYEKLEKLAEEKRQKVDEYAKAVLQEHVKATVT